MGVARSLPTDAFCTQNTCGASCSSLSVANTTFVTILTPRPLQPSEIRPPLSMPLNHYTPWAPLAPAGSQDNHHGLWRLQCPVHLVHLNGHLYWPWYPGAAYLRAVGREPGQLTPIADYRLVKQDPRLWPGTALYPFDWARRTEEV